MNCISFVPSAYLLSRNGHVIMRNSLYRLCISASTQAFFKYNNSSRTNLACRIHYFSSTSKTAKRPQISKQPKAVDLCSVTDQEKEAFYVVQKGHLVGIYKRFSDCQAQLSSSVHDQSDGVYKGYYLQKKTDAYIAAKGLKNAIYTLHVSDLKDDLFGNLIPCPIKEVIEEEEKIVKPKKPSKKKQTSLDAEVIEEAEKIVKPKTPSKKKKNSLDSESCIIEFDGASKGNPGRAGAGAVLRTKDGTVIARLCEGLGDATNNVAEYRALILGLKCAEEKGFKNIQVKGDSNLVVKQVNGDWKCGHKNMKKLNAEVKEIKKKFTTFEISHVYRDLNGEADAQANFGAELPAGEVQKKLC